MDISKYAECSSWKDGMLLRELTDMSKESGCRPANGGTTREKIDNSLITLWATAKESLTPRVVTLQDITPKQTLLVIYECLQNTAEVTPRIKDSILGIIRAALMANSLNQGVTQKDNSVDTPIPRMF